MERKGSVTIFFSLSLSTFIMLTITLAFLLIQNSERVRFYGAFDIALNSCLGEYSKALYQKYDLIYVDTSYMNGSPSLEKLENHLKNYFIKNAVDVYQEPEGPFGSISLSEAKVTQVQRSTAKDGMSLRHQAVESLNRSSSALGYKGEALEAYGFEGLFDLLEAPLDAFRSAMGTVEGLKKPVKIDEETNEEIEVEVNNPAKEIFDKCGSNILETAKVDISNISDARVDISGLYSRRNHGDSTMEDEWDDSAAEFGAYVLSKFGNYRHPYSGHRFSCEMEYMINQKNSDLSNLTGVVNRIFAQRFANNLALAFLDQELKSEAKAVALALEVCTMSPEFTEPVTLCILLAAAYQESVSDVHAIMSGGKVPPVKTSHNMSVTRVLSGQFYYDESLSGWSYEQYLLAMLYRLEDKEWNERVIDVIELEIQKDTGNPLFSMDGCIERIGARVSGKGRGGNELVMQRIYGLF